MNWIINYAVSSTVMMLIVICIERRLRPEWREAALWLSLIVPILIATAGLVPTTTSALSFAPAATAIAVELPIDVIGSTGSPDIGFIAIASWLLIASLLFVRDVLQHRRLIRALDRSVIGRGSLTQLSDRLGLGERVILTQSDTLPVPIAMGSREICIPAALLRQNSNYELEPIIAHELAHLRRRDPRLQQIARLISVALWWQPLNRVIANRLSAVAELRTDELCTSVVAPMRLANALVRFAQQARTPGMTGMPAFPAGLLQERVSHLLRDSRVRSSLRLRLTVCLTLTIVSLAIAPRFALLRAQLPTMFAPLVVKASLVSSVAPRVPAGITRDEAPRASVSAAEPRDEDVVGALARLLGDPEKHVRAAARESLRRIGTAETAHALANDRFAAADALKESR